MTRYNCNKTLNWEYGLVQIITHKKAFCLRQNALIVRQGIIESMEIPRDNMFELLEVFVFGGRDLSFF